MQLIADSAELWNEDRSEMLCEAFSVGVDPAVRKGATCAFCTAISLDKNVYNSERIIVVGDGCELKVVLTGSGLSHGRFHATGLIMKVL